MVEILKADLLPQHFAFVSLDEKSALFTLDRGLVIQKQGIRGNPHVFVELRIWFKPQTEQLEVSASEEVVAEFPPSRLPVRSQKELENLQRLLDSVRADVEARQVPGDSAAKRDSSHS